MPSCRRYKFRSDGDAVFRQFNPVPEFSLRELPEGAHIRLLDGSFWVVDQRTGVRYRRVTMDDLPKNVTWNTRGPAEKDDDL